MFEQYPFAPKIKVLELGSGRGELWNYYFENDTFDLIIANVMLYHVEDINLGKWVSAYT